MAARRVLVLHNRLLSTNAAVEHTSLIRSTTEKGRCGINVSGVPGLPIPDGFPFTIANNISAQSFTRQDKDETVEVKVDLGSDQLINGDLCFPMCISIWRGHWGLHFEIIVGPKTLLVQDATISQAPGHKIWCFEEFLVSKGIDKGFIISLMSLLENTDERIDA